MVRTGWIPQRYEIAGKAAGAATEDDLRLMMQGLLQERFKLAVHRQTKELSAYVLVPGKNGPKVQESKTEGETSIEPNQRQMSVTIQRAPVSQLVEMLSNVLRAPVVDQTGLKGRYDLTVNIAKYAADMAAQGKVAGRGAGGSADADLDGFAGRVGVETGGEEDAARAGDCRSRGEGSGGKLGPGQAKGPELAPRPGVAGSIE